MILVPAIVLAMAFAAAAAGAADPFADAVHRFDPGERAGFGSELLPGIVLGPPRGAGALQGSFDVVSLGIGGSIVLRFDLPLICDGPGADFTVFENAFHSGSPSGPVFAEYGFVAVSQDGEHFVDFPYDASSHAGLAGQRAVLSHPDNGIDPLDPSVSGGDQFDLASVGLAWAAYVRVTDVAGAVPDPGDLPQFSVAPSAGFDLDAIAALHACDPGGAETATPTPTPSPSPAAASATPAATTTATAAVSAPPTSIASATATGTPEPPASPTATSSPSPAGDLDGDGRVTAADLALLLAELFDGDGDGAGTPASPADVNRDGRITAADVSALVTIASP